MRALMLMFTNFSFILDICDRSKEQAVTENSANYCIA